MGIYNEYGRNMDLYKVVEQVGFRVGGIREQKTELARVERAEAEPRKVDVDCPKPSWVSDFNRTVFFVTPI